MENKFDLIERYLNGEMPVKEQTEFEDLLRADKELMNEFLFRRKINEAISEDDIMKLREKLNEIVNPTIKLFPSAKSKLMFSSVAAVFIAFVVIGSIYLFPTQNLDKNRIFQSYYSPYPTVSNIRSSEEHTSEELLLFKALESYEKGNYTLSVEYFHEILGQDSSNKMAMFYTAICEIERNNLSQSENYLNSLISKNNHIFWEQSHWYLALVYLKQEDYEMAEFIFTKIIEENMDKKTEAEAISRDLN